MQRHVYLPDPVRGLNRSRVFVSVRTTDQDAVLAARHLTNPGVAGVRLRRVPREPGMTVLFEVVGSPGVRVGCSSPSSDSALDIAEIRRALSEACSLEN